MKKHIVLKSAISFIIIVILPLNVMAGLVTDVYIDNSSVVSYTFISPPIGPEQGIIIEDYGETFTIPYDGSLGIVNTTNNFFDLIIEPDSRGIYHITLSITNSTPYDWDSYNFEFYEANEFETSWTSVPIEYVSNNIFSDTSIGKGLVNLSGLGLHDIGEANLIDIRFSDTITSTFGLRQVASSAVPIPGAVWLLGSGLIGLVAVRRRIHF